MRDVTRTLTSTFAEPMPSPLCGCLNYESTEFRVKWGVIRMVRAARSAEAVGMSDLRRPTQNRVIAGVCAGLAERFGLSRTTVRVIALLSCLLPGPQFIAYIALWIIIPSENAPVRLA